MIIIEIDDWYFYTANFEIMIPSRITIFSSPNPRINRVLNLFLKIWTKKKSSSLENKQKRIIYILNLNHFSFHGPRRFPQKVSQPAKRRRRL